MSNKFTAIYTDSWMSGSHRQTLTRMLRVEQRDGETVSDMLKRENIDDLVFLFYGHPAMEGEESTVNVLANQATPAQDQRGETMDQMQIAAKMAGDWWAKRLSDKYAERRPALASAVAQRVADTLNGVAYWDWQGVRCDGSGQPEKKCHVECDYEPNGLLASAVAEVFSDMPSHKLFTSLQDLFPSKHDLLVTREALHPKEGYGHWTTSIRVRAVGEE